MTTRMTTARQSLPCLRTGGGMYHSLLVVVRTLTPVARPQLDVPIDGVHIFMQRNDVERRGETLHPHHRTRFAQPPVGGYGICGRLWIDRGESPGHPPSPGGGGPGAAGRSARPRRTRPSPR